MTAVTAPTDVARHGLAPPQRHRHVVKDEETIKAYPGVVVIDSVDGLGPKWSKVETYNNLMLIMPRGVVHAGFKLFFDEDRRNGNQLMTPVEVLRLKPQPEYVMYE